MHVGKYQIIWSDIRGEFEIKLGGRVVHHHQNGAECYEWAHRNASNENK